MCNVVKDKKNDNFLFLQKKIGFLSTVFPYKLYFLYFDHMALYCHGGTSLSYIQNNSGYLNPNKWQDLHSDLFRSRDGPTILFKNSILYSWQDQINKIHKRSFSYLLNKPYIILKRWVFFWLSDNYWQTSHFENYNMDIIA